MCTGVEIAGLALSGLGTAAGTQQARKAGRQQQPTTPQPEKSPDQAALRRRAQQGLRPGGALGAANQSMLTSPAVGLSTLLGQ